MGARGCPNSANYLVAGVFPPRGQNGAGKAFFGDFEHARARLDMRYPRKGRVWQAPDDNAVWSEWCLFSRGKAVMCGAKTTPTRVTFHDGTVASFRTSSKSGGYTIDFNTPTHTKIWKIHVA